MSGKRSHIELFFNHLMIKDLIKVSFQLVRGMVQVGSVIMRGMVQVGLVVLFECMSASQQFP